MSKGVRSVKLHGGKYCTILSETKRRENEDAGVVCTESNPAAWFEGTRVYVSPHENQTIDLVYKAPPTDMALGDPADTDCVLSQEVQDIIVEMAEGRALRKINPELSLLTIRSARDMIETMNGKYKIVDRVKLEAASLANTRWP